MRNKLATVIIAYALLGCGLNTSGMGEPDSDGEPDVADEAEPDFPEMVDIETVEENAGEEDSELDDGTIPDETAAETEAVRDDSGLEDSTEDETAVEDSSEVTDEGGEEDGETVDPCAPPEIPSTGIFLFYCLLDGETADNMILGRRVEREGAPNVDWAWEPSCSVSSSSTLWCDLSGYRTWSPATVHFNISVSPDDRFACERDGTTGDYVSLYGTPRVWQNGTELALEMVWNGLAPPLESCNFTFRL